jgi:RimJ/RimL family protein N-acetyltransferase
MSNDRPIGKVVDREVPVGRAFKRESIQGKTVSLVPLSVEEHGNALYASFRESDPEGRLWTYMAYGPFENLGIFQDWLRCQAASADPLFYTIVPGDTGTPSGMASFMRMDVSNGVAEIGNIWFAPGLQRSRAASEAIFLMMRHVLDTQGCRRLEWKCNNLNAASRRAAERFGFAFEGVFRNHMVIKGRNRDTAWYAITEEEWPPLRKAFEDWLEDGNFDSSGEQRRSLSDMTAEAHRSYCA